MSRWQLVQVGREELHRQRRNAQLALLGARRHTGNPDDVSALEVLVRGDERLGILRVLLGGHDLDLSAFAMEVVELELRPARADVVNAPCEALHDAVKLRSYWDNTLWAVLVNIGRERARDVELVRVRIRALRLLEFLYLTTSEFVVLLHMRTLDTSESCFYRFYLRWD